MNNSLMIVNGSWPGRLWETTESVAEMVVGRKTEPYRSVRFYDLEALDQRSKLLESGLIGPVTLQVRKKILLETVKVAGWSAEGWLVKKKPGWTS